MFRLPLKIKHSKSNKYSTIDNLIFFLLSSYFITIPFYLWNSGLPQISDLFMVMLLIIYLFKTKGNIKYTKHTKSFLFIGILFIFYTTFINIIWMFLLEDLYSFIDKPFFYIYNYLIAVLIISLYAYYDVKIIKLIYRSVITSVLLQTIIFFINGGYTGGRMIGSFNNPNQLGYYALLCTSILIVASNKLEVKPFWFIITYFSNALLIIASLSSATIISYMILTLFFVLSKIKNKQLKRNFIVCLMIILIGLLIINNKTNFFEKSLMIKGLQTRSATVESKTSGIVTQRGYDRLIKYPEYWIFGAGEGAYLQRFGIHMEFHSLLGNIQVSYGIIGLLLFLRLLFLSAKKNGFRDWYILLSILVYGITHNGVRNSLLWVLLSLMLIEEIYE